MMLRSIFAYKPVLAVAAVLALGILSPVTDAVAARYSHRAGVGIHSVRTHPGFAARNRPVYRWGHRQYAHRYVHRPGFRVHPRYYRYYDGCYSWRWVATPWGWRLRRLNVCYPYYRQYYYY
jgi:hypothetical protein